MAFERLVPEIIIKTPASAALGRMTAALIAQERKVYPPLLQIHIFKPYRQLIPQTNFRHLFMRRHRLFGGIVDKITPAKL